MPERRLRLLVATDEPTRTRLCAGLGADPRFGACLGAGDAPEAVRMALERPPDLCLLDVRLVGGGIAAAAEISARLPQVTVVMLAAGESEGGLFAALRAGAVGYLAKELPPQELADRLAEAANAGAALPQALVARVLRRFRDPTALRRALAVPTVHLTSREWQVLELLREGKSTYQVARRLSLAPATVRSHRSRILRKLRKIGVCETELETLVTGEVQIAGSRRATGNGRQDELAPVALTNRAS